MKDPRAAWFDAKLRGWQRSEAVSSPNGPEGLSRGASDSAIPPSPPFDAFGLAASLAHGRPCRTRRMATVKWSRAKKQAIIDGDIDRLRALSRSHGHKDSLSSG